MGKGKLQKFADMAANPLVVECPYGKLISEEFALKGRWNDDFFHNQGPIVLELGCGRGEYTVGLARRFPDMNFIGVDIKGARMWHGAKEALENGSKNVGFVRTNIECIDKVFGENEVSEIWLTFCDPQMKKPTKRLTATFFLERYRNILVDGGLIHLKTDSNFLYTYTKIMAEHNHLVIEREVKEVHPSACSGSTGSPAGTEVQEFKDLDVLQIQTYYEQMWREKGLKIKYLSFHLPKEGLLEEPGVEIEMDDYRSYGHEMVKERKFRT